MRSFGPVVLLAAAAVCAAAGFAGVAAASQIDDAHVLSVRLPDGSVEQIRYAGDTAPEVRFGSPPAPWTEAASPADDVFGPASPFAALERMSAAMDRQAMAMLQQAKGLSPAGRFGPEGLTQVDMGKLPAGVQSYSVVSTLSGGSVCTHSVEYTSQGQGKRPRVVTRTSGNCGAAQTRPAPSASSAQAGAAHGVRRLQAAHKSAHPAPGPERELLQTVSAAKN